MDQFHQQQFDFRNMQEVPPPPLDLDGASHGVDAMPEGKVVVPVQIDGIWETQPPLDPSLMDIAKIAIHTRKIFGTDDLSLLIPKVS
jgi:hypothetical protein